MARIRNGTTVFLAVGMLAVAFFLTYQAGTVDRGPGPPVVEMRN